MRASRTRKFFFHAPTALGDIIRGLAKGIRPCCIWHFLTCPDPRACSETCLIPLEYQYHACPKHRGAKKYPVYLCQNGSQREQEKFSVVALPLTDDVEQMKQHAGGWKGIPEADVDRLGSTFAELARLHREHEIAVRFILPGIRHKDCPDFWSYEMLPEDAQEYFGVPSGRRFFLCEHFLLKF